MAVVDVEQPPVLITYEESSPMAHVRLGAGTAKRAPTPASSAASAASAVLSFNNAAKAIENRLHWVMDIR